MDNHPPIEQSFCQRQPTIEPLPSFFQKSTMNWLIGTVQNDIAQNSPLLLKRSRKTSFQTSSTISKKAFLAQPTRMMGPRRGRAPHATVQLFLGIPEIMLQPGHEVTRLVIADQMRTPGTHPTPGLI
jgi:hypothetical protein